MGELVRFEDRGAVRWLILDRPEVKNAIPAEGWRELEDGFAAFEESEERVLVVTGAGDDFCAGADLARSGFQAMASVAENAQRMRLPAGAATALHRISKPTLAAVDGVAVGAGMNLAIGCDIVIASDRARFAELFVRRGLTMDFGGTWLLPRLVGLARARELALTGRMVAADEALDIGLVSRVVPVDRLEDETSQLAEQLAVGPPLAQRFLKAALDRSTSMTFEQSLAFEDQAQALLLSSEDVAEGARAFLERRDPEFKGR